MTEEEDNLLYNARNGCIEMVQDLLLKREQGVLSFDINCKGTSKANRGWTALHLAAYFGHVQIIPLLLQHGADVDSQNDSGDTPLHRAAYTGRMEAVTLLLKHDADVTLVNAEGRTAKELSRNEDIHRLIEAAENYETKKLEGQFLKAARDGDIDLLQQMMHSKTALNINCTDSYENTALHNAAYTGRREAAVLLLQNGIDSRLTNIKGQTAEQLACDSRMKQLLRVTPSNKSPKHTKGFEGPLLKKSRILGLKPVWVVLEKGVWSTFSNRADASTGSRRKSFKYLDGARVETSVDGLAFSIVFSNAVVHSFSLEPDLAAQLNRQKWVTALQDHIAFSDHFVRQGAHVSDEDNDQEIMPLGSLHLAFQTAQAHQQVVENEVSAASATIRDLTLANTESADQVSLVRLGDQLAQVVETSKQMCQSLNHCLKVFTQQEEVRQVQLGQQEETCRVLQDALHVLAQQHHDLEQMSLNKRRSTSTRSTDSDQDEFHDAMEQQACSPNNHHGGKVKMTANGDHSPVAKRSRWGGRSVLPSPMFSRNDFSVWSILKQCIGKELSKITMPVIFNEPLSFLQRVVEYMEYATLLRLASDSPDPLRRLELVTAFAVSATASNWERIGKPFNPLLGETYELTREDLGFRIVCEQVSHHPPVSAFHAESAHYRIHGAIHPKLKFWGKSVEVTPKGLVTLHLLKHNEIYTWQNVNCCVHNIIVGKIWVEHYGSMEITNHSTQCKAVLNFKPSGWFSKDLHKVEGYICDRNKRKLRAFYGKWIEALYSYDMEVWESHHHKNSNGKESAAPTPQPAPVAQTDQPEEPPPVVKGSTCDLKLPQQVLLWEATPKPPHSSQYYQFTDFAMMLNEREDSPDQGQDQGQGQLPSTDCRLRPDMRKMEHGDIDGAAAEKNRLEEKQRHARKERRKRKEEWKPRWFTLGRNPHTDKEDWLFTGQYWKKSGEHSPDIF